MEKVYFKGIKINSVLLDDAYKIISENVGGKGFVCLNDVRNIMYAVRDKEMMGAANSSMLSLPDGMPLVWYVKMSGCSHIERIPGVVLMRKVLEEHNGFKHFLLGDTNETIAQVIEKARKTNPEIQITGYSPPFKSSFDEDDNADIFKRINRENPDLIWVSFGGVKQEKWMHQNLHRLHRGIMVGAGAAFRFYTGVLKTPPKIVQKMALQWLFRMIQVPQLRTAQVVTVRMRFLYHLPWEVIKSRIKGSGSGRNP